VRKEGQTLTIKKLNINVEHVEHGGYLITKLAGFFFQGHLMVGATKRQTLLPT
jgi:hypothetical protein